MMKKLFYLSFLVLIVFSTVVTATSTDNFGTLTVGDWTEIRVVCAWDDDNSSFGVIQPDNSTHIFYQDVNCPIDTYWNRTLYQYDIEGRYYFVECEGLGCWNNFSHEGDDGVLVLNDSLQERIEDLEQENIELRQDVEDYKTEAISRYKALKDVVDKLVTTVKCYIVQYGEPVC